MNKLTIIFICIVILICLIVIPLIVLTSKVPDASVPEGSESQFIEERYFGWSETRLKINEQNSVNYFEQKIAFVLLRGHWIQEIRGINRQTDKEKVEDMLIEVNNHMRNALEITSQHIQNKYESKEIVNNILAGSSQLGAFSDIYGSIDDADTIMKSGKEIENALQIAENYSSFEEQIQSNIPYTTEANLIAMQAAQYYKYKNKPELEKYFLNWESNFRVDYDRSIVKNSIKQGRGLGFYVQVKCLEPETRTVTYINVLTGETHDEKITQYCSGFVSELIRLDPMVTIIYDKLTWREDIDSIDKPIKLEELEERERYERYLPVVFTQEELFQPVLGELHGQNVTEISQMKKYIESKQRDEIPTIRQRISNMRKKLAVPWQPYTMPEPKMESILNEYSYLQKGGLLGLLSEFNESKIRKSSSGEYIYIDETAKIQAFSKLLKSTPTSDDFEKYYETRLLTIKTDLDELENKYPSDSSVTLLKVINFYNR